MILVGDVPLWRGRGVERRVQLTWHLLKRREHQFLDDKPLSSSSEGPIVLGWPFAWAPGLQNSSLCCYLEAHVCVFGGVCASVRCPWCWLLGPGHRPSGPSDPLLKKVHSPSVRSSQCQLPEITLTRLLSVRYATEPAEQATCYLANRED